MVRSFIVTSKEEKQKPRAAQYPKIMLDFF